MSHPVISLTSDFGDTFAQSQVEVVVHNLNPGIKFIVASNDVSAFSILEGAFVLLKFYALTPYRSIHLAIVDPGVGSQRRGVFIRTKNHYFVGPDNGVLYPAAHEDGIERVFVINERAFGARSNTFHGRDVFAKAAGYISLGNRISEFSQEVEPKSLVSYVIPQNRIAHIDPYGNIKLTNHPNGFKHGEVLQLQIRDSKLSVFYGTTFADADAGQFILYVGSHGTIELAVNRGSAAKLLGVCVGDQIEFDKA